MSKLNTLLSFAALLAAFSVPVIAQNLGAGAQSEAAPAPSGSAPAAAEQNKAPERAQESMNEKGKPQDSAATPQKKQRQAKGKNPGSQPDTVIR